LSVFPFNQEEEMTLRIVSNNEIPTKTAEVRRPLVSQRIYQLFPRGAAVYELPENREAWLYELQITYRVNQSVHTCSSFSATHEARMQLAAQLLGKKHDAPEDHSVVGFRQSGSSIIMLTLVDVYAFPACDLKPVI
jgi:hypothetical protein